jgi:hypothetical protein
MEGVKLEMAVAVGMLVPDFCEPAEVGAHSQNAQTHTHRNFMCGTEGQGPLFGADPEELDLI